MSVIKLLVTAAPSLSEPVAAELAAQTEHLARQAAAELRQLVASGVNLTSDHTANAGVLGCLILNVIKCLTYVVNGNQSGSSSNEKEASKSAGLQVS